MKFTYIKYKGYMTDEVKDFCGEDNIISENRDGISVLGYFLKVAPAGCRMLMTNHFIIKNEDGSMYITMRLPETV